MFKKAIIIISMLAAQAIAADSKQLFDCVDKANLEISSQCVANKMSANFEFEASQEAFYESLDAESGAAISSISYYPEQNLIKISAPRINKLQLSKASK